MFIKSIIIIIQNTSPYIITWDNINLKCCDVLIDYFTSKSNKMAETEQERPLVSNRARRFLKAVRKYTMTTLAT